MKRYVVHITVVLALAACSPERAPLVATDVLVNKPVPGTQMSAGYFTMQNNSDQPVTITRVVSPQFESVEMHE